MNRAEYKALFADQDISHIERSLYLYLRWHMDYSTGVVGESRKLSYQGIIEHLEVCPNPASHEKDFKPSRDQIKRLLNKLIGRNWIAPLHDRKSQKGPVRMAFRLVLASADLVRSQEERHQSATGAPQHNPHSARVFDFPAHSKVPYERHTSDLSDKDNIYNACVREDLVFDDQFALMAKQSQLIIDDQGILDVFEQFKFSPKDDGAARDQGQWLKQWRSYCVNVRINNNKRGGTNAINQQFGNGASGQNATARALAESKRAAEYCAEEGIDGSVLDQIISLSEGQA